MPKVRETPDPQLDGGDVIVKRLALRGAFSPAAPIDKQELFAGRSKQVSALFDVILERGQHAIIYGERGVGKTSLASVIADILSRQDIKLLSLRANCDATDDFSRVWRKVLDRAQITEEVPAIGFVQSIREATYKVSAALPKRKVSPEHVRKALSIVGTISANTVVFLDEFDRIQDPVTRNLFADTIKTLSDQQVPVTIVIVGVADNVDELIAQHQSVERALVQIQMPWMSTDELKDIVRRGLDKVGMTIRPSALLRIADLSQGLPHYCHLLGKLAAEAAVRKYRNEVNTDDVDIAVNKAIDQAQRSIIDTYYRATISSRGSIYDEVLLACAMAKKGATGYFQASDVREPLSQIMGKRYDIPAFARHLNMLSHEERGPALQKRIFGRRSVYRFVNPLLQPYVIMKGLSAGRVDVKLISGR